MSFRRGCCSAPPPRSVAMAAPPSASCKRSLLREEIAASERLPPSVWRRRPSTAGRVRATICPRRSRRTRSRRPTRSRPSRAAPLSAAIPTPRRVASAGSFEVSCEGEAKKGGALNWMPKAAIAPDSCMANNRCRCRRAPPTRSCCTSTPSSRVTGRLGGSADVWVRPAAQRASASPDALEARAGVRPMGSLQPCILALPHAATANKRMRALMLNRTRRGQLDQRIAPSNHSRSSGARPRRASR